MKRLSQQYCENISPDQARLSESEITDLLSELDNNWNYEDKTRSISRVFTFNDYYQTLAFVNATAWVSQQQNHHPEIQIGFKHCLISYSTHSINGLSHNDFICAARINDMADT
ncbi:MAG: 4a-hydroxytetrahydrobiopterin dehydratase [Gammaproteobacteria bacterium]|nr:4a-hydroxytetrahydrobiopterin dehydratase [Gammaproteobacteria bacterium]